MKSNSLSGMILLVLLSASRVQAQPGSELTDSVPYGTGAMTDTSYIYLVCDQLQLTLRGKIPRVLYINGELLLSDDEQALEANPAASCIGDLLLDAPTRFAVPELG